MNEKNLDPMKMQTAFLEVVIPPDIIYEEVRIFTTKNDGKIISLNFIDLRRYDGPRRWIGEISL
jgi:hypothetical protein